MEKQDGGAGLSSQPPGTPERVTAPRSRMSGSWLDFILAKGPTFRPGSLNFFPAPGSQPCLSPVVQEAKKPLETYMCSTGTSDLSFPNSS